MIKQLFHFPDANRSAVLDQPLSARTIRKIVQAEELNATLLRQLGTFIAGLHRCEVYLDAAQLSKRGRLGSLRALCVCSINDRPLFFCNSRYDQIRSTQWMLMAVDLI